MKFRTYTMLSSIKKYWTQIELQKVYQSYDYNLLLYKYRKTSFSNIKRRNTRTVFIVAFEEGKAIAIAPLIIDSNPKCVRLLGYGSNSGQLDFIYGDEKYVEPLYKKCVEYFVGYRFDFSFVPEKSPLRNCMNTNYEFENYYIRIDDYNQYYSSLSKNMRQNIRTAYNRIATDEKRYTLEMYNHFNSTVSKEIDELYLKRKNTWTDGNVKTVNRYRDVVYKSVDKLDIGRLFVLKIEQDIAAFFVGYEAEEEIQIPRLAINENYSRYSPGIILINEYLKLGRVKRFDLGRGQELYKVKLNGTMYKTYNLIYEEK